MLGCNAPYLVFLGWSLTKRQGFKDSLRRRLQMDTNICDLAVPQISLDYFGVEHLEGPVQLSANLPAQIVHNIHLKVELDGTD